MSETRTERDLAAALDRARACSPFLALQSERFPEVTARLESGDLPGALAAAEDSSADPARALRRTRSAHALALGIADLAGAMTLEEVTAALSGLADRTLETAIAAAVAERTPGEAARGFLREPHRDGEEIRSVRSHGGGRGACNGVTHGWNAARSSREENRLDRIWRNTCIGDAFARNRAKTVCFIPDRILETRTLDFAAETAFEEIEQQHRPILV